MRRPTYNLRTMDGLDISLSIKPEAEHNFIKMDRVDNGETMTSTYLRADEAIQLATAMLNAALEVIQWECEQK